MLVSYFNVELLCLTLLALCLCLTFMVIFCACFFIGKMFVSDFSGEHWAWYFGKMFVSDLKDEFWGLVLLAKFLCLISVLNVWVWFYWQIVCVWLYWWNCCIRLFCKMFMSDVLQDVLWFLFVWPHIVLNFVLWRFVPGLFGPCLVWLS